MSKTVKTFLRGAVWEWLVRHTHLADKAGSLKSEHFFVVPVSPQDPDYGAITASLIRRFSTSKTLGTRVADEFVFRHLSDENGPLILASRLDGLPLKVQGGVPFEFAAGDATFLQRMEFITSENIPAPIPVPARLLVDAISNESPVFEADLEPYLPQVVSWRITPDAEFLEDSFDVSCVRILINLGGDNSPARRFSGPLSQLALVMPTEGHEWLFEQLFFALTSRKHEHLFLGLYKLLEFFFPLRGVSALKKAIGYNGSFLELRAYCSDALGWNINHHTGARAAAHLCTEAFANICLGRTLPSDSPSDILEKHKIDAIGKISELRHSLAHQSFATRRTDEDELNVKTGALLALLIEAFSAYKQHQ